MKCKTSLLCFDRERVYKEFLTSVETQHALILRNSICFKIKLISGRYAESERCM